MRQRDRRFPSTYTTGTPSPGASARVHLVAISSGSEQFEGEGTGPPDHYIVAPSTHGANSAAPKSNASLLVGSPDATRSIRSKIRSPHP